MLQPNAVITLNDAKQYLGISGADFDSLIERFINLASDEVERYCNCKFSLQTVADEIHNGDGTPLLTVRHLPIYSLANGLPADLRRRQSPSLPWEPVTAEITEIFIDPEIPWIELLRGVFPRGAKNISVSYKAGYEIVPGAIQRVVTEMAQMLWNESKQGGDWLGRESKQQPEGGYGRHVVFRPLKPEWKVTLDYYRRMPV